MKMTTDAGEVGDKTILKPYQKVDFELLSATNASSPKTYSIAIRDARTDDCGYDDGNILTDMLLSSELRGFVAYPAYYFA